MRENQLEVIGRTLLPVRTDAMGEKLNLINLGNIKIP